MFIHSLKIKSFGHVIKYLNTLFRYDIILDIHLYRLSYVCGLGPGAHMRCIRFLSKTGCDRSGKQLSNITHGGSN
jgi:hypothetical protein